MRQQVGFRHSCPFKTHSIKYGPTRQINWMDPRIPYSLLSEGQYVMRIGYRRKLCNIPLVLLFDSIDAKYLFMFHLANITALVYMWRYSRTCSQILPEYICGDIRELVRKYCHISICGDICEVVRKYGHISIHVVV